MSLRIHPLLLSVALLAVLSACGTTGSGPAADSSAEYLAEQAYTAGDFRRAAEYWQQAGRDTATGNIDSLRVKTAEAWLRSRQTRRATELLSQVDQASLGRQDLNLFYIAHADLALQQGDPVLADFYLQAAALDLPSSLRIRFSDLQTLQYKMQRDPFARDLSAVVELSNSMIGYQLPVALEILRSLESVPSGQLTAMIDTRLYDPEFTEWLELSLQVRNLLINGSSITAAARNWANYHYGHAITESNFPELISSYNSLFPVPSRVAILLPAEGSLAAAAKAIRDGIVSAYLEQPGDSVIRFYSSGENSESAIAAYLQASADGATQIVGPLRIESTRTLASLENLSVPILLLNEPAGIEPVTAIQTVIVNSLSLSQTEEALAIAGNALAQGHKQALVIVPDNAWGTRIETAFATKFEQGEGHISATAHFDTQTSDHSAVLTQLLKIDESKQRKTQLQSRLGIPLTFEPSRRDDFDLIFMAANPAQGRELKPLLRFHDVGDIPVYAMGRIFSGRVEQASDQDLNGIVFPATSWQLHAAGTARLALDSIRGGSLGNLFALGLDAWRVLPWLPLMQKDPELWFPGEVGDLRLQVNGRLYRQPAWAKFSAGRPVPYQWSNNH